MKSSIKSVYEIHPKDKKSEDVETVVVAGFGQSPAKAVDKQFKKTLFKKILKGFMVDERFVPLRLKSV